MLIHKQRWVGCSKPEALPLSQYITRYIDNGPLPQTCFVFITRTRKKLTLERNGLAIPLFRSKSSAEMYAQKTQQTNKTSLITHSVEKLLAERNLPTKKFVLDFEPYLECQQVCTVIQVYDIVPPSNANVPQFFISIPFG